MPDESCQDKHMSLRAFILSPARLAKWLLVLLIKGKTQDPEPMGSVRKTRTRKGLGRGSARWGVD